MVERTQVPQVSTFVVRFWREWSATGFRWRGCIEHIQSGQRVNFVELEGITEFVRAYGIMAADELTSGKVNQ
jgi:hypothetical protein